MGEDLEADRNRFPFITPGGIIVLPKGTHVPKEGPVEFAHDMAFLIQRDAALRPMLEQFDGTYRTGIRDRHSHDSGLGTKNTDLALKGGAQTI